MQPYTTEEIDFKRLLNACERFLTNDDIFNWRFEKYIQYLDVQIIKIRESHIVDDDDRLKRYQEKLRFLKNKQAVAKSNLEVENSENPNKSKRNATLQQLSQHTLHVIPEKRNTIRKRKTTLHSSGKSRAELLVHRSVTENLTSDELKAKQRKRQETLENQLLDQAVQLKTQSRSANDAIKNDMKIVADTDQSLTKNTDLLDAEISKLQELNKSSSVCGLLSLVFFCFMIFVGMIIFIRIFPTIHVKKKW